jgi:phosphoglycolate phosphatase
MTTAIVFDLDGTLADSSPCIVGAAHHISDKLGLDRAEDSAIRQRIGEPLAPMLSALYGIRGELLDSAVREYSTAYVELAPRKERLFEGAIPLVRSLREGGFKLAIATGKSQRGAENATARLGLAPLFDSIHGIVPGTPGKPDPAVLVRAMAALGVSPEECVMVGDTTFDLDLSHAAGVRTAAVCWGMHSLEVLRLRKPAFIASTFQELRQWLLELSKH